MRTRPFLSVTKVTSQRKAGCITIAPLMISFMGVCHGADKSNDVWRIVVLKVTTIANLRARACLMSPILLFDCEMGNNAGHALGLVIQTSRK